MERIRIDAVDPRPRPSRLRLARVLGFVAGAAAIAWVLSSATVAWKLTRRPRPPFAEPIPEWSQGLIEALCVDTRDGESLGAWILPAPAASVAVLVLHGHGGSRNSQAELLRWLAGEGATVLAPSLRAHGDSSGARTDFGWGAREDVIACISLLEARVPGVPIVVVGESLGAVAAMYAAGDLGLRVAAYVLEAPYRDLPAATRHRLALHLPRGLDAVAYAGLRLWAPAFLAPDASVLRPIDRAPEIPAGVDVVFLSGTADRHAPLVEVEEIRARCAARARLVAFPGASHAPLRTQDPGRFQEAIREVLSGVRKPRDP